MDIKLSSGTTDKFDTKINKKGTGDARINDEARFPMDIMIYHLRRSKG